MDYQEVISVLAKVLPGLAAALLLRRRNIVLVGFALFVGFMVCDWYLGGRVSETATQVPVLSDGLPFLRETKPYLMWITLALIFVLFVVFAARSMWSNRGTTD